MKRHHNDGLKKRCTCSRRTWPKCPHGWHFGFHHGGKEHRYSLDKVATLRGEPKPRTKGEAQAWADILRGEIRNGADPIAPSTPTVPSTGLTFGDLCDHYIREHVEKPTRRPNAINEMRYQIAALRRAEIPGPGGSLIKAETKPLAAVTKADAEAIRANRRRHAEQARVEWAAFDATHAAYLEAVTGDEKPQKPAHPAGRRPGAKDGEVSTNRLLARLRHIFSWAIEAGHLDATPFKRGGVTVIHLEAGVEKGRRRRLVGDEEERLLKHAGPHLHAMIVAALETGCRRGELLSMRRKQIEGDQLYLPPELTKTNEARVIPLSKRLRAVLEMRRTDPKGNPLPPTAYVFGTATGEPVKSIKTAWKLTCRRAGIVDLRFHDLRRSFASALYEATGGSGHDVRDWLGHANISTTSRYLSTTVKRLRGALDKFEQSREPHASIVYTNERSSTCEQRSTAASPLTRPA